MPNRMGDMTQESELTIFQMLKRSVEKYPERHALGYKSGDNYQYLTYRELWNREGRWGLVSRIRRPARSRSTLSRRLSRSALTLVSATTIWTRRRLPRHRTISPLSSTHPGPPAIRRARCLLTATCCTSGSPP